MTRLFDLSPPFARTFRRVGLGWLLCVCLLIVGTQVVYADAIEEDAYWALVDAAAVATEDNNEAALDDLAQQFEAIDAVTLDNGEQITIDHAHLAALLRDGDLNNGLKAERLRALAEARGGNSAEFDQTAAIAALDTVLGRSEFQYESLLPDWLNNATELIIRALTYALELISRAADTGVGTVFGWVAAGIAVLLLFGFLAYWVLGVRRQFSTDSELADDPLDVGDLSATDALQNAQEYADSSDYRQAVRYLYISVLLSLDERGLLRYDRSKTNREYLRSVRNSEFAPTLRSVIDVFDRVWYGFQPIDATTYERYADAVRKLMGVA